MTLLDTHENRNSIYTILSNRAIYIRKTYQTFDGAMKTFLKDFNFRVELPDSVTTLKEFGGE